MDRHHAALTAMLAGKERSPASRRVDFSVWCCQSAMYSSCCLGVLRHLDLVSLRDIILHLIEVQVLVDGVLVLGELRMILPRSHNTPRIMRVRQGAASRFGKEAPKPQYCDLLRNPLDSKPGCSIPRSTT